MWSSPAIPLDDGTTWFVSPLDVRFTHDSISDHFQPFLKVGQLRRLSILDSIKELLQPIEAPRELEIIDVVWHKGLLYVAGTFNRRLCMHLGVHRWNVISTSVPCPIMEIVIICKGKVGHSWEILVNSWV